MASKGKQAQSPPTEPTPKVKAACQECRTRKVKCDGIRPKCSRCQQRGISCDYDTEPDEFRITAFKRRYAELAQSSSTHTALVKLLRERPEEEAYEIVNRIRSDEDVKDIIANPDDQGGNAEQNLISAIEQAKGADVLDHDSSSRATSRSDESDSSTRPLSKTSIAFLCDIVAQSSDKTVPVPHLATENALRSSASALQGSAVASGFSRSPAPEHKKHRSSSMPSRSQSLASSTHGSSARPIRHPKATPQSDRLATRRRSTDRSWMSRVRDVKAAEWEVYYTDDETFLEILRCYFVWENPSLGIVNEESFWEGLASKGSEFCNHALVHAIMAFGSKIYGMFHPDRAASVEHFAMQEVTKIWDWDADATVPANTAAGLLIHTFLTSNGQDEDGQSYMAGAWNLADRSGLFDSQSAGQVYPASNETLAHQRAVFAWNIYAHHGYHTLSFSKPSSIHLPPPIAPPNIVHEIDSKQWSSWPLEGAPRPGLMSSKQHARATLWQLGSQVLPLHRQHSQNMLSHGHWQDILQLHRGLREWYNGLNSRLHVLHGAAPHVFSLHNEYHRCVVDLFRPFVHASKDGTTGRRFEHAVRETDESHSRLRLLIHQMELEFPHHPLPICALLTPLVMVANETLPLLRGKGETSDEVFYFCLSLKLMRRMVNPYPVARFFLLGIHQIAHRLNIDLPDEALRIIKNLDPERRTPQPVNSFFPLHLDLLASDMERAKLSSLIAESGLDSIDRGR
ncbi:hypothetical protein DOTSEDRAFT_28026 [Dothistroma septosporum NZE10]|uniref:Zn(2)-C6 fungal-type domain-containing protein n=1 Tax=Dothistroma septosporum (strain NZE10 / CBS 128990) TaxID=675120 RepID=N1PDD1_DOTSN|nr:hypothetical protein DOTSEDRAFT_28026 [Dothistroma septosporum NZE10]